MNYNVLQSKPRTLSQKSANLEKDQLKIEPTVQVKYNCSLLGMIIAPLLLSLHLEIPPPLALDPVNTTFDVSVRSHISVTCFSEGEFSGNVTWFYKSSEGLLKGTPCQLLLHHEVIFFIIVST